MYNKKKSVKHRDYIMAVKTANKDRLDPLQGFD